SPTPPFDGSDAGLDLRRAVVQAVDRDAVVHHVFNGMADSAPGPIPPASWAYAPSAAQHFPFDQAAASRALDKAGWVEPAKGAIRIKNGQPLQLTMEVPNQAPYDAVAGELKNQLRSVGIDLTVDKVTGGSDYIK